MKTSIAAFVTAAERFVAAHPDHPGSVALLITSDEEGPVGGRHRARGRGAEAPRRDDRLLHRRRALVGAGLRRHHQERAARHAHRAARRSQGVQGHVAYPAPREEPGAPRRARDRRARGRRVGPAATSTSRRPRSRSPTSTPAPARRTSSPGQLQVDFNFRFSTESTPESLKARVKEILERHGLDFDDRLDAGRQALPHRARPAGGDARAVREAGLGRDARGQLHRRHLRRALHLRHLPAGRGVRAGEPLDPQGERGGRPRGDRAARRGVPPRARGPAARAR